MLEMVGAKSKANVSAIEQTIQENEACDTALAETEVSDMVPVNVDRCKGIFQSEDKGETSTREVQAKPSASSKIPQSNETAEKALIYTGTSELMLMNMDKPKSLIPYEVAKIIVEGESAEIPSTEIEISGAMLLDADQHKVITPYEDKGKTLTKRTKNEKKDTSIQMNNDDETRAQAMINIDYLAEDQKSEEASENDEDNQEDEMEDEEEEENTDEEDEDEEEKIIHEDAESEENEMVGEGEQEEENEDKRTDERDEGKAEEHVEGKNKASWKVKVKKSKKVVEVRSKKAVRRRDDKPGSARKRMESMGMIFMCSSQTKNDCYHYSVFGLPASKRDIVEKIYKGMRLFLYDVDLKLMYGIYKAAGPGGYNIEPKAFKSQFPSQVRFTVLDGCLPLAEEKFKKIIKENYYTRSKFDCQLNSEQVKKLCKLFIAARKGCPSKMSRRNHKVEDHIPVRQERTMRRTRDCKRKSALEERPRHDRPRERRRDVPLAPRRLPPPLPAALALPPPALPTCAYDRTLEVDPYRRDPYSEHREPYRDGRDTYLEHHEPYREERDPYLECRGSYRDRRSLYLYPRDHRDGRYLEPYDAYRREPISEHHEAYRQDRLVKYRMPSRQDELLPSASSEARRQEEIGTLDSNVSYPYPSYAEPSYSAQSRLLPEYRPVAVLADTRVAMDPLSEYYARRNLS